jgi:hypothetical protein
MTTMTVSIEKLTRKKSRRLDVKSKGALSYKVRIAAKSNANITVAPVIKSQNSLLNVT